MENKIIEVEQGLLRGRQEDGTLIFMGVPFAAPPVGDLRWREPEPAIPWRGVRDAFTAPPMPVQTVFAGSRLEQHMMSEDCLYLNIWAPAEPEGPCPVLVWFYGGALQAGNSDSPLTDGKACARDGVILVTVGYRVGVFGFMCHPDMRMEDPNGFVGNFGHRDQLAALRWIHENIASFGGDPDRVTVSGQSAGSASCCAMMNAPSAKGYLHGAICQSGDIFQPERDVPAEEAEIWGRELAESFGCASLGEFRKIPFPKLYADGDPMMKRIHHVCAAVIDGAFLPDRQGELILRNECLPVPVIIGSNLDEGSRSAAETYIPAVTARLGISEDLYAGESSLDQKANALARDYWYGRHLAWAKIRSLNFGLPVWQYVFARRLGPAGAFHGAEIPYAFETLDAEPDFGQRLPYTEEDRKLAAVIHGFWMNFVKNGDPNGPGLPAWPKKNEVPGHMRFDLKYGMSDDILRPENEIVSPAVEAWMRGRMKAAEKCERSSL